MKPNECISDGNGFLLFTEAERRPTGLSTDIQPINKNINAMRSIPILHSVSAGKIRQAQHSRGQAREDGTHKLNPGCVKGGIKRNLLFISCVGFWALTRRSGKTRQS